MTSQELSICHFRSYVNSQDMSTVHQNLSPLLPHAWCSDLQLEKKHKTLFMGWT